jgi:GNAT superfamily N-acetyltransferase
MSLDLRLTDKTFPARYAMRRAGVADAAFIAELHCQSWRSAYRGMMPDAYLDGQMPAERLAHWQQMMPKLEAGAGTVVFAERDGQVAGFFCVMQPDAQGSVLLEQLHAVPGSRGGGVGTAMLEAARAWALARGARAMHLLVLESNGPAIGFYESRGWRLAGRKDDDVLGGINVVALRYVLPMTQDGR